MSSAGPGFPFLVKKLPNRTLIWLVVPAAAEAPPTMRRGQPRRAARTGAIRRFYVRAVAMDRPRSVTAGAFRPALRQDRLEPAEACGGMGGWGGAAAPAAGEGRRALPGGPAARG